MERPQTSAESVTSFASRLGISPRMVQRLVAHNRIPVVHIGRRVVIPVRPALAALGFASVGARDQSTVLGELRQIALGALGELSEPIREEQRPFARMLELLDAALGEVEP